MNNARIATAIMVVLLVTGVTLVGTTPVAADHTSNSGFGEIIDEDDSSTMSQAADGVGAILAGIDGARQRASFFSRQYVPLIDVETSSATEEADAVASYYNSHNATLEAYTNERTDLEKNHTIEMTWHLNGETETRYLLADQSNGSLTTSRVVNSSERTPTHTLEMCGYAADQSEEELRYFVTEYAEPNKDVDNSYRARLKGKYNDDVETSLLPSDGDC